MEGTQTQIQVLEAWLTETGTKLTQVNGQRKYGGPPEVWDGPPPGSQCEVYISQIPLNTYEDVLIPLFRSVGPLWEFRLMMNFSGQNRGFAYAKYSSPYVVRAAVRLLNGHKLESGFCLSVRCSTEKRDLCIGQLPASTEPDQLLQILRVVVEGVERISLQAGLGIEGVSAVVTFSSHYAASMAKRVLVEEFKNRFMLSITVTWQSTMKSITEVPPPSHKFSKRLTPLKWPRHVLRSPQSSPMPPRLDCPPSRDSMGFYRAVGRPAVPQKPPSPSSSLQGHLQSMGSIQSPMALLHELCEALCVGEPHIDLRFSHAGAEGFLYFFYDVSLGGITSAFKGLVMVLPGHNPNATLEEATLEEAQQTAALQVLQKF
ncbi:hypothetical protein PBY51_016474 [Eleginops maclovinus]|uniref:RRM domain-containing protein n=1 Tax=Eleginops maclovinus TaxID=56733 RepID=A0AAN7XR20_ELEMC|nr:hypothetical protein PBY51_016474 [Eleginops maclovinus]